MRDHRHVQIRLSALLRLTIGDAKYKAEVCVMNVNLHSEWCLKENRRHDACQGQRDRGKIPAPVMGWDTEFSLGSETKARSDSRGCGTQERNVPRELGASRDVRKTIQHEPNFWVRYGTTKGMILREGPWQVYGKCYGSRDMCYGLMNVHII